jgi:hypothetical protein
VKKFLSDYFDFIISGKPGLTDILVLLMIIFLATAFIIFLFILISRVIDNVNTVIKQVVEKRAQQIVIPYLFNEEEWDYKQFTKIRKEYLSNRFRREVFLDTLTKLQTNIVGKSAERLKSLYIGLRLHRRSLKKLNSSSWNVAAKGIVELAEMDMKEYLEEIRSFINHKNPILRSEAQIALIQLEYATPFSFLNDLREPILDWQQSKLAHVSEQLDISSIPEFSQWLDNKEDSIVIFCIRMISLHNQFNASEKLITMLKDDRTSERVRGAIIFAIRQLELYDTTVYLMDIFPNESLVNKQEIIKTLSILNNEASDVLLNKIFVEGKVNLGQFYPDTTVFIPEGDLQSAAV